MLGSLGSRAIFWGKGPPGRAIVALMMKSTNAFFSVT